jgi:hypothetical protein
MIVGQLLEKEFAMIFVETRFVNLLKKTVTLILEKKTLLAGVVIIPNKWFSYKIIIY